ncbi:MAG: GntR family transcriptional regulator [Acidimicrobiales bacterium]
MPGEPREAAEPSLHQRIYRALREQVVRGDFKPGELLSEAELARTWSVSRSPIREAIRQLEQDGLVRWSPRRGATVTRITVAGVRDVYEVREALESLGAALAAERASADDIVRMRELAAGVEDAQDAGDNMSAIMLDDELHRLMATCTRNRVLKVQAGRVLDRVIMARMMVREEPGRAEEIVREHWDILEAMEQREAKRASELAALHVQRARARLMEMLQRAAVDHED